MTYAEELAKFVVSSTYQGLSTQAMNQLKIRVLDSSGCAIGALSDQPGKSIRKLESEFGGATMCSLIGGGKSAPDRAAFYNGALVRYLDFNDSFLSKARHATQAITLRLCLPLLNMLTCRERNFWLLWRWHTKFNAG